MSTYALNVPKFHMILDQIRESSNLSWREVARQTGVSHTLLIRQMPEGYSPNADALITLLLWSGIPMEYVAVATECAA